MSSLVRAGRRFFRSAGTHNCEGAHCMGKPGGFLEYPRIDPTYRPVTERIHDYREFVNLLTEQEASRQGARCMDCGVPFCHWLGCPLHNSIPNWNDFVYRRRWKEAYEQLELTSSFPEIIARVCPGLCEAACTLSVNVSPVSIRQIELFVAERAFENGWVVPRPPAIESNKRVAVVGSGPAGLAAAQKLRRFGHAVRLFEKSAEAGRHSSIWHSRFQVGEVGARQTSCANGSRGDLFRDRCGCWQRISRAQELLKSFDAIVLTPGRRRGTRVERTRAGTLRSPSSDGIFDAIQSLRCGIEEEGRNNMCRRENRLGGRRRRHRKRLRRYRDPPGSKKCLPV